MLFFLIEICWYGDFVKCLFFDYIVEFLDMIIVKLFFEKKLVEKFIGEVDVVIILFNGESNGLELVLNYI